MCGWTDDEKSLIGQNKNFHFQLFLVKARTKEGFIRDAMQLIIYISNIFKLGDCSRYESLTK